MTPEGPALGNELREKSKHGFDATEDCLAPPERLVAPVAAGSELTM